MEEYFDGNLPVITTNRGGARRSLRALSLTSSMRIAVHGSCGDPVAYHEAAQECPTQY